MQFANKRQINLAFMLLSVSFDLSVIFYLVDLSEFFFLRHNTFLKKFSCILVSQRIALYSCSAVDVHRLCVFQINVELCFVECCCIRMMKESKLFYFLNNLSLIHISE